VLGADQKVLYKLGNFLYYCKVQRLQRDICRNELKMYRYLRFLYIRLKIFRFLEDTGTEQGRRS
jgi:hypothetical protein